VKKLIAICLCLILVFGLVACGGGEPTPTPTPTPTANIEATPTPAPPVAPIEHFVFSSAAPGSVWYILSEGLITWFNQELGDVYMMDMRISTGSAENVRRLNDGEVDFSIAYGAHLYETHTGTGIFVGHPSDSAQLLFQIGGEGVAFVALQGSGINTVSDLAGRSVVLGPPGSSTSEHTIRVLEALGILDTVDITEASFADGVRALQEGLVDAIGIAIDADHPHLGVLELAVVNDILIVPFTEDELASIFAAAPYYTLGVLSADTYHGQVAPVSVPWFHSFVVASQEVSAYVVYDALAAFFRDAGKAFLTTIHHDFAAMTFDEEIATRLGVPVHPGALRFFERHSQAG